MAQPAAKRIKTSVPLEDKIAVVDFGGQYVHLIAMKVRAAKVKAEILQPDDATEKFHGFKGIILSGSPSLSAKDEDAGWNKEILDLDIPILGFCFGHQEIAKKYGGTVSHADNCEWGHTMLHINRPHALFEGLSMKEVVWMSHFDTVQTLGPDFEELGYTQTVMMDTDSKEEKRGPNAAICSDKLKRYGFQFHPEVDTTENGDKMIANFALKICECKASWDMKAFMRKSMEDMAKQVGDRGVFLLVSGGVDSTVCAAFFHKFLPAGKLKLLHIDNGLMRKDESKDVVQYFADMGMADSFTFVDASEEFVTALQGVSEPEKKRGIIGNTFIEVFEREARKLGLDGFLLGQGTIYPDTIETGGTKRADLIKTHHNRVPLVEQMIRDGKVIEPLVELYKPEVRELAVELGVKSELIGRHPFPGPGLGVRLLCSMGTQEAPCNEALSKVLKRFEGKGMTGTILPIKSVGVKADLRSYERPCLISCTSKDPAWDLLVEVARVVLRDVPGVNRVIWNLQPGSSPFEVKDREAYMTRERLDLLREADQIVMDGLRRHNLYDVIWQCPTASIPCSIGGTGRELIVVRPVDTQRAMTAKPAKLPAKLLDELRKQILALPGVAGLAYDLTSKPPGTIEWE